MEVTIQLSDEAAYALQHNQAMPDLDRLASQLGLVLEPLHPNSNDRALRTFFHAKLPGRTSADRIISRLLASPHVVAAYIKPPEGPPGT